MREFIRIGEANLSELLQIKHFEEASPSAKFHLDLMIAYHKGDLAALDLLDRQSVGLQEYQKELSLLAHLRLKRRQHILDLELVQTAESQIHKITNEFWKGELYFFLGLCFEDLNLHSQSIRVYEIATKLLFKVGAKRKSVKSLHNTIAAQDREGKLTKLMISDYQFVAGRAIEVGEFSIAGIGYMNISREYQRLGALDLAVYFSERAFKYLKDDIASLNYFLLIAHQCDLLIQVGRLQEAQLKLNELRLSPFKEIEETIHVLNKKMNLTDANLEDLDHLNLNWQERKNSLSFDSKKIGLGEIETQIIEILSQGPAEREELISQIYGDKVDFETLLNRFKVCLSRLRKKWPGLVIYEKGKYRISNEVAIFKNVFQN